MTLFEQRLPKELPPDFENVRSRFILAEKSRGFQRVNKLLSFSEKKVLDIGCCCGEFLILGGAGSVGVTVNEEEARMGRALGMDLVLGNVLNTSTYDAIRAKGSFELIWAMNILEHLEAPHVFLRMLSQLVPENGRLILGVPVFPAWTILARIRKFRGAWSEAHINFFTRATLDETVRRAGWQIETTRPFVFGASWLDRLFRPWSPVQYVVARKIAGFHYPPKRLVETKGRLKELFFDV